VTKIYDAVVVGGGIVGSAIFRDLSLHNLNTLLIDKYDFSSQTSHRSSKMLHGGIRYLENLDFELISEALSEKNLWIKLAPHLCYESPFYLPIFKNSKQSLWKISIGLKVYDFLSSFNNTPHKILNKKTTITNFKNLKSNNLTGAGLYYDGIVNDSKLNLEVIYDGLFNTNSKAQNYTEITGVEYHNDHYKLSLLDTLTLKKSTVISKELIFATGPFTDQLLSKFIPSIWHNCLLPSKGIHLWIDKEKFNIDYSLVMIDKQGRLIFIIPHENAILVGTTETEVKENFFNIEANNDEKVYLLNQVNEYFPSLNLNESSIISSFAGVRPLVMENPNQSRANTARNHKYFQPFSNMHVIVGGKYTTFRTMGQEISRTIIERNNIAYSSLKSIQKLRQISTVIQYKKGSINKEKIIQILKNEYVKTFSDLIIRRLGISNKNGWNEEISFNQYFIELLPVLNQFIKVTESDIIEF
jgi:glycerol-3-phosphate dehydrogenase